tara:strand:+ start:313 stop:564 length:252 start_codon:yes stop_codon:yes gene_type:complete
MAELQHAFYSKKQENVKAILNKNNKSVNISSTHTYKLHNSNKKVVATCLFRVDMYPNYKDCDIRFDDVIYLGVVDLWISNSNY